MSLEEEVVALRAEGVALREALAQAQAHSAELERRTTPPPSFVRANTPTDQPAAPRRKRAPPHNAGRRRAEPTQIADHAEERCPDCGRLLRGQSVARSRQVSDRPAPAPGEITAHRLRKRHGPACDRWWTPQVDFGGQVWGQGRCGVRLVRVIADLRQRARLPLRTLQHVLATLDAVRLARGARVALRQRVQPATRPAQEALLAQARATPIVQMDATGWRANGQNGDVWGLGTPGPEPVCSDASDRSRAGAGAASLLADVRGHVVTDSSGAYHPLGCHPQRCGVHLLRDLQALQQAHATDAAVGPWAQAMRTRYDEAPAAVDGPTVLSRRQRTLLARPVEAQA